MFVSYRRWNKARQQAVLAQLTEIQREQLTTYPSKGTGWFTVAAGATLLATGDTWQIAQHYRWPVRVFWLLVVVMLTAAVLNTAVRMSSRAPTRHASAAESASAAEQR